MEEVKGRFAFVDFSSRGRVEGVEFDCFFGAEEELDGAFGFGVVVHG
jgi:hypothetical protein